MNSSAVLTKDSFVGTDARGASRVLPVAAGSAYRGTQCGFTLRLPARIIANCAPEHAVLRTGPSGSPGGSGWPVLPAGFPVGLFDSSLMTKAHRLGAGLSITRAIIAQHDGRIGAATRPGGGTVLRSTLALAGGSS